MNMRGITAAGVPTCTPLPTYGATWSGNCSASVGNSCSITVPSNYAAGSSAGTIGLAHSATGSYVVTFPWIANGVPLVSTYGSSNATCKVISWTLNPVAVYVSCINPVGSIDADFNISVTGT